jgi:hypothetical protein
MDVPFSMRPARGRRASAEDLRQRGRQDGSAVFRRTTYTGINIFSIIFFRDFKGVPDSLHGFADSLSIRK